jgi:hypothetical protein
MNLDKRTQAFSMLTSMRENGHDYISCFVPIVLQAVPSYDFTDCQTIHHDLADSTPLLELMVKKILNRAKEEGYVEVKEMKGQELFKLKPETVTFFIEEQKTVKKRMDALVEDINSFFVDKYFRTKEPILEIIDSFIDTCGFEINLLPREKVKSIRNVIIDKRGLSLLVDYLRFANDKQKLTHLNTFKEVVMGKIISTVFDFPGFSELNLESFDSCQLFLDTNFIFSILKLHEPSISEPALKLFNDYLKQFNFKLNIFDFTKKQICMVLQSYSTKKVKEIPGYALPSVYRILKRDKWSKERIRKYIDTIESELKEKGIEVVSTSYVLNHYVKPKDNKLAVAMGEYRTLLNVRKPNSTEFGKQHDMAAIMMVEEIRGSSITEIKNVNSFFLTSDHQLRNFNKIDMKHNKNRTIPEVVLDTSFSSMLWALSPKLHKEPFSLETIIAAFSRNWFISNKLWEKFRASLEKVLIKKGINVDEVSSICYYNLQNISKELSDDEANLITPEYIEAKMEEANIEEVRRKQENKDTEILIHQKDQEIVKLVSEKESLNKECKLLKKDNESATKKVNKLKIALTFSFIVVVILVILVIFT